MVANRREKDVKKIRYTTDDTKRKLKPSKYKDIFEKRFNIPSSSSFAEKSKVTGVPKSIIEQVHKKGMAAWKSGHRVGTTAVQWGHARVNSFLTLGCTAFCGDASLLHEVHKLPRTPTLKKFFAQTPSCTREKIQSYKTRKNFPSFLRV